jgi:WD40 repeat protein
VSESQQQLTSDPELSLLLAVRAAGIERSRLVEDTLRQALESSRIRAVQKIPPARQDRLSQPGAEASAVSRDGRLLVMGRGNTARLVSRRTGRSLRIFKGGKLGGIQVGHRDRVLAVALSRDGKELATGSKDGTAGLWRVADGFHITTLIGGHIGPITTVAFNPRGDFIATGSRDRTIRIFDTAAGRQLLLLAGHKDEVKHVEYNRVGNLLRSFSTDGTERIWDPEPEPRMHVIGTAPLPNPGPHMAAEGDKRATAARKVVVLRDLSSGSRITLRGHKARVTSLHFDSRGKRLLTADEKGDMLIWDAETGAKRHLLRGHFGVVSDARFSPDGRWIVSAGPFSAGLWRSDSNTIHTFIRGTDRPVVARFEGNNRIVTIARDGKVREWFCDFCGTTDELLALAKKRLAHTGRTLTPEQKRKLLPH